MNYYKSSESNSALTFIELLISSAVLILIMATVYSAFQGGIASRRNIESNIQVCQIASRLLERLDLDLRNSFVYSEKDSGFKGDAGKIEFFTVLDSFGESGMEQGYALVSYELSQDKVLRGCRRNADSLKKDAAIEPQEAAYAVKEFSLGFGLIGPDGQTIEYASSWSDPVSLPQLIRIKLAVEDKKTKARQEFERSVFLPLSL